MSDTNLNTAVPTAAAGISEASGGTLAASGANQTPTPAVLAEPRRDFLPAADKVLIIGLDGATFDILTPMMDSGRMPNLTRLVKEGSSGILYSTQPPITPAAWTTFMTGKGPGRHGIVDFERYDVATGKLSFNSTYEIRERTIWEILGEKGFRVGAIHVPMTYPPRKVNGFMVSGFETPSIAAEFTWPPELKQEILRRWPHYSYRADWKRRVFGRDEALRRNLRHIERSFHQGAELTTFCGERYGWDVLMVLFKLVDNLQHKTWKYLDPKTSSRYLHEAELAANCFVELDKALGTLFEYARRHSASILMMSDHGHGSLDGKAQPNLLLKQWGYLKIRSSTVQIRRRLSKTADRLFGRTRTRFDANLGIEHELVVDWAQTRACVIHAGMNGFLYISLKGRQPNGVVEPSDYEKVRDDLRNRFVAATCTDPAGREIRIFPEVHKPEELYGCSREEQPWMPDLLLVPQPGLAVVRRILGRQPVRWSSLRRLEGTHRVEGILIANGPHIRQGGAATGRIVDIAPTLLAAMGLKVPSDMEGSVLTDLFAQTPTVEYELPQTAEWTQQEGVYSEAEKEILTRRLTELGYLE
ncbi:MAG: alkaline phosphatase family protein [Phycisphaerae bacterium]|nr:alkaline phosphatase family protein [Phycisphaerae bacterium]